MKILAFDTSSKYLSIGLADGEKLITQEEHLLDRQHSGLMLPKIKAMLEKIRMPINKIDAFVVGLGPGSFTGLRIGVSSVKGFGIALKKPCVGVPSIDAIAMNAVVDNGIIVPVIDAKRGNVYSALYKRKGDQVIRLSGYQVIGIEKLMRRIKSHAIFLGDGIVLYGDKIKEIDKKAVLLEEKYWYPSAFNLIKLAIPVFSKAKTADLSKLRPMYLYPKDCQIKK